MKFSILNFKFSKKYKNLNQGFVMLFAVTLSAILLSISLGVTNIAYKEIRLGTSARDTNDAFFAADTGIECALVNDKAGSATFVAPGAANVACLGGNIPLSGPAPTWSFVITGLGSTGQSCSRVTVNKDTVSQAPYVVTTLNAKGYNIGDASCTSTNLNRVEREIILKY